MNIGILFSKHSDLKSSQSRPVLHEDNKGKTRLGKVFERSIVARRVLLFISMLGTCMLIGDVILTPAISALVETLSPVVLLLLFVLQRYGTSGVSFLFSMIMGAWTLSTPLVGIYSIIHHYPSIFEALSPDYIIYFFWRNGKEGWLMLNGTILCITGSEAMFADLGHFNRRSIQIAFLFTIHPSLVLTYAGQTAYLIKNPNDRIDGFYKFMPKTIYWPIFIIATLAAIVASRLLISATFCVIKQSVVLDYFPRAKLYLYLEMDKISEMLLSSHAHHNYTADTGHYHYMENTTMAGCTALHNLFYNGRHPRECGFDKIPEGGWIPFAISFILAFIMFGWYYGRQRKIKYELTHKIDLGRLGMLLSDPSVQRVPGLCFFSTNIQNGLTPILGHYIQNMRSLHKVTIFTTQRYLLVPKVAPQQRIVVKKLGLRGVYACVIRYGYADSLNLEGDDFVSQVMDSLRLHIENCYSCSPSDPSQVQEEISDLSESKMAG